jgi:hypothetical protein
VNRVPPVNRAATRLIRGGRTAAEGAPLAKVNTKTTWHLQIDRIVVTGVVGSMSNPSRLHALIEAAVTHAVEGDLLPAGRMARTSVQVDAPALGSDVGIAQAVGAGISQVLRGGRSHG